MNKTVKTIAWICLVLGLMGIAVDVGAYVYGRSVAARVQESIESGDFEELRKRIGDVDDDGDIDDDDRAEWPVDRKGAFKAGARMGYRTGFGVSNKMQGGFGRIRGGFGFPLLLLAAGPVLTVVGAVMLIVNREPKPPEVEEKKTKTK
jgi:hypothetical protein